MNEWLTQTTQKFNASLGIWYLIILNAFGVFAICCKMVEYQTKRRNVMFIVAIIANICWVLYFALYGDAVSALTCLLNTIRLYIFSCREKHRWAKSMLWLYFFIVLQIAISVFTYNSWKDLFPIIAGFLGIFAYFINDAKVYRLLSFIYMSLWVLNGIFKFYPIALISDSMSVISCAIAIYRFDIKKQKKGTN